MRPNASEGPEARTRPIGASTRAVRAGRGPGATGEPLNLPPVFASAFHADGSHSYAREGNPTWAAFERAVGELDGGEAVAFSSGMAAIVGILEELPIGARVLALRGSYVELAELLAERAAAGRLAIRWVDATDTRGVLAALDGVDLLWLETLTNPMLDVPEVDVILDAAGRRGIASIVDGTLATPFLQRPLQLGADVVVHSASKYIGGHSDLLLGVATTRDRRRAARLRRARTTLGAVPGAMEAFLGLRGLRTLPLRLRWGCESALELARRLERHPAVSRVHYPGLACDRGHDRAARLLDGFGAVIACELTGGAAHAAAVCRSVRVWTHATSLGGVESLIEHHFVTSGSQPLPGGLVRMSVGCEDTEDLWEDLDTALSGDAAGRAAGGSRRRVRTPAAAPP